MFVGAHYTYFIIICHDLSKQPHETQCSAVGFTVFKSSILFKRQFFPTFICRENIRGGMAALSKSEGWFKIDRLNLL